MKMASVMDRAFRLCILGWVCVLGSGCGEQGGHSLLTSTEIDATAPAVGTISFGTLTQSSIQVNWTAASDNATGTASLQYKAVKANSSAAIDSIDEIDAITGAGLVLDWAANTLTTTVTGLTSSTAYHFAVLVKDAAGNKAFYSPGSASTTAPDTTAPTVGSLSFANVTNTSLDINWTVATDAGTATANLQYKLVRATAAADIDTVAEADAITGGNLLMDWTTATLTHSISSGLNAGDKWAYAVLVRDLQSNLALYTPAVRAHGKLIYLTTQTTTGNLGGVNGADTFCANNRPSAGDSSASVKAFITGPGRVACSVANCGGGASATWPMAASTTYYNTAGLVVGTTTANKIFSFNLSNAITATTGLKTWGGFFGDWTDAGSYCANWTSALGTDTARVGWPDRVNSIMLSAQIPGCNETNYLICFEQ